MGLIDRSEVELAARLVAESRASAQLAVDTLTEQGTEGAPGRRRGCSWPRPRWSQGDAATARRMAQDARAAFTAQRRAGVGGGGPARRPCAPPAWRGNARRTCSDAARAAAHTSRPRASPGRPRTLASSRPRRLELGRPEVARRELALASRARHSGPVELRVRAWHAVALLRLADGNRRGAGAALLAGVRLLEHYRAALGATELRAHASSHGTELDPAGPRSLAVDDGDAERRARVGRALARRLASACVPSAHRTMLAGGGAERAAGGGRRARGRGAGRPAHRRAPATPGRPRGAGTHRARHAPGRGLAFLAPSPRARELRQRGGTRAGRDRRARRRCSMHAVVVAGRCAPSPAGLGRPGGASELEALRFSLRRLALSARRAAVRWRQPPMPAASAPNSSMGCSSPRWPPTSATGRSVMVPTGGLHAVPWSVLPTCAGRSVTVAPSAAAVAAGQRRHPTRGAGRRRPRRRARAAGCARRRSARWPAATPRPAGSPVPAATCRAVCAALDGPTLAHVAAHGRFRADNPLFSCLQLADGPLTVYDLEALKQAPRDARAVRVRLGAVGRPAGRRADGAGVGRVRVWAPAR